MKLISKRYFELFFWITSLLLLAMMDPGASNHYSLCLFNFLGISFCPGCGIGHSISYLFHGNISASFAAHPMGIIAVPVIFFRIYQLLSFHIFPIFKTDHHGLRQ